PRRAASRRRARSRRRVHAVRHRVLPDRRASLRPGCRWRIRRTDLCASARASALHHLRGARATERDAQPHGAEDAAFLSVRAVVFAYHDVGDRCLRALVSHGWDVPLVVTHEPDPRETPWFASVAETASALGVPVLMPATADQSGLLRTVSQLRP